MSLYQPVDEHNPAIFICGRCRMKRSIVEMLTDPNTGLKVCSQGCCDVYDPWRLPARQTEDIALEYPRPDEPLTP